MFLRPKPCQVQRTAVSNTTPDWGLVSFIRSSRIVEVSRLLTFWQKGYTIGYIWRMYKHDLAAYRIHLRILHSKKRTCTWDQCASVNHHLPGLFERLTE